MHESGVIEELLRKVESLVRENSGRRASAVTVRIGPLAAIEPEHLREHFEIAALGTAAEQAELRIVVSEDLCGPEAGALVLESVEIETD